MRSCQLNIRAGGRTVRETQVDLRTSGGETVQAFLCRQLGRADATTGFDLYAIHQNTDQIVSEQQTLQEVLGNLVAGEALDGQVFILEISASHVGAVRVACGESCYDHIQQVVRETRELFGTLEACLELGGVVRGETVYIARAFVAKATIDSASFLVTDRALADLWRRAEEDPVVRELSPVGSAHCHPFCLSTKPEPSSVDVEDAIRMGRLYSSFTTTKSTITRPLAAAGTDTEPARYRLGDEAFVEISVSPTGSPGPGMAVQLSETRSRSYWTTLIVPMPLDGAIDPALVATSVLVQERSSIGVAEASYLRHDLALEVVPDEELCDAGLARAAVRYAFTREEIRQTLLQNYSRHAASWHDPYQAAGPIGWVSTAGWGTSSRRYLLEPCPTRRDVAMLLHETARICAKPDRDGARYVYLRPGATVGELADALAEALSVLRGIASAPQLGGAACHGLGSAL